MATATPVCGICDLRHESKPSVIWCSDCDEGLCTECKEHHSLSKATRKHSTISIADHQKLPPRVLEIQEYCEDHGEKFQSFCHQHNCPCCRRCVLGEHKKCETVTTIESVVRDVKTSNIFQETEELIDEIVRDIGNMRKNRTENLSSVQADKRYIEKEINGLRSAINKHLDNIQEKLINELTDAENKVVDETTRDLASLKDEEKEIEGFQENMSSIKQYATDLQAFLYIDELERGVAKREKSVRSFVKTFNNTTLSCEFNKVVQQFQKKISTLGRVIVHSRPSNMNILKQKEKQAQILAVNAPNRSIENITLRLLKIVSTNGDDIRGCVLLSGGRMVFSDFSQSRVRSININGSVNFDTGKMPTNTFDIAYLEDDNTIAVTSGGSASQCIKMIDIRSGNVKKTIPVKSYCDGITYGNNALIFCAREKGLRMINLSNESISDIVASGMSMYACVATLRDKLFYTNKDTHTVTCCDFDGTTLWNFKDESVLGSPQSITVDNAGNVFVLGKDPKKIVVISSDGQHRRQLLLKERRLEWLRALCCDFFKNQLLVTNEKQLGFLFQIENQ